MKIITDTKDWADAVASLNGPVYIATYNIAAFQSRGPVFRILESLNAKDTSILVGVPGFKSCTDYPHRCKACLTKHKKSLSRLVQLREHYKNIKWSFVKESHAKFAVGAPTVIIGGRNLSDSRFHDITVVYDDCTIAAQLVAEFETINCGAYDIGSNAPLVFQEPYRGELMADSSSIREEFKNEVIKNAPQSDIAEYWMKNK